MVGHPFAVVHPRAAEGASPPRSGRGGGLGGAGLAADDLAAGAAHLGGGGGDGERARGDGRAHADDLGGGPSVSGPSRKGHGAVWSCGHPADFTGTASQ